MRIDTTQSVYREHPGLDDDDDPEFEPEELVNARALLRRLHFLESQSKNPWAEAELEALVWILDDIGFLADR